MQRCDLASEFPQGSLEHLSPQNRNCLPYFTLLFTLLSLTGAVPHHVSLEKVNLDSIWSHAYERMIPHKSLCWLSNLPNSWRLLQLVIVDIYPTVRGMRLKES